MFLYEMDYNPNFSIFNINSYFTLTSFDSDITNQAFHNLNQLNMLDWFYPTQHTP